jgi:hypothetical protein
MTVVIQTTWLSETSCPSGSFDTTARLDAAAAQQRNQRWLVGARPAEMRAGEGSTSSEQARAPIVVEVPSLECYRR